MANTAFKELKTKDVPSINTELRKCSNRANRSICDMLSHFINRIEPFPTKDDKLFNFVTKSIYTAMGKHTWLTSIQETFGTYRVPDIVLDVLGDLLG